MRLCKSGRRDCGRSRQLRCAFDICARGGLLFGFRGWSEGECRVRGVSGRSAPSRPPISIHAAIIPNTKRATYPGMMPMTCRRTEGYICIYGGVGQSSLQPWILHSSDNWRYATMCLSYEAVWEDDPVKLTAKASPHQTHDDDVDPERISLRLLTSRVR